jgi:CBS domain-containing protein
MATIRQLLDEKGHDVITVGANEPVADAPRKMADANVGSLVVCEGTKVVGIITQRHYARNVFLEGNAYRTRASKTLWRPQSCSSDPN